MTTRDDATTDCSIEGRTVVVHVHGSVGPRTCESLRRALAEAIDLRPWLVVDLSDVTALGGRSMQLLELAYYAMGQLKEAFVIRNPPARVLRQLDAAGLSERVTIERTPHSVRLHAEQVVQSRDLEQLRDVRP